MCTEISRLRIRHHGISSSCFFQFFFSLGLYDGMKHMDFTRKPWKPIWVLKSTYVVRNLSWYVKGTIAQFNLFWVSPDNYVFHSHAIYFMSHFVDSCLVGHPSRTSWKNSSRFFLPVIADIFAYHNFFLYKEMLHRCRRIY